MAEVAPLYQTPAGNDAGQGLEMLVDQSLRQYFRTLNGMSPGINLYDAVMQQAEKPLLENVLRYVRGNQVRAATILGINRNTLRKKIQILGIELDKLDIGC